MKTMKKLLVVLVALLVVGSATVVAVFASDPPQGDLSVAGQKMSAIESATTVTDKIAAINEYDEYMATHTFPTDALSELNKSIIVENANAAKIAFTKENIERIKANIGYQAANNSAKENVAVANYENLLNIFDSLYFMEECDEYRTFKDEYDTVMAKIKKLYDARIEEFYTPSFGEYEYGMAKQYDFEVTDAGTVTQLGHSNFDKAVSFKYEYKQEFGSGAKGSSGYYYEKTKDRGGDPYVYINGLSAGTNAGVVLEFDYYHVAGGSLQLSRGSVNINGKSSSGTEYGIFKTASYQPGYSSFSSRGETVQPSGGVLVENSWNRIAIALNAETGVFSAYANYELLTTFMWTKPGEPVDFVPDQIRFKYKGDEMRLDNIRVYYGTQPRIIDRFDKMTDEERFLMYSEVIADATQAFADRDGAYNWMRQKIESFYDFENEQYADGICGELKAAVDAFLVFDYPAMKIVDHVSKTKNDSGLDCATRIALYDDVAAYIKDLGYIDENVGKANVGKIGENREDVISAVEDFLKIDREALWAELLESNMVGLRELAEALAALESDRSVANLADRNGKVGEIDKYIETVTQQKLPEGLELSNILLALETAKANIEFDRIVEMVKNALDSFATAPTYESQKKWVDRIEALLYVDGVSIFSDTSLLKELEKMKFDYENMSIKIDERTRSNNSKKIVQAVHVYKEYMLGIFNEQIKAQTPDYDLPILMKLDAVTSDMVYDYILDEKASFDAGEISKATAWEYVRTYTLIAATAVKEGYDESYEGVDEAIEFNTEIYAYYYDLMQQDHVKHLTETLERYDSAKTYADRLGICTYIENYIALEDIDTSREAVAAIIARVAEIREVLIEQDGTPSDTELEYLETIKANTSLFVAAVNEMLAMRDQGYAALYDAWQEALKYYYFMEITSDEVQRAIAEYALLERQLLDWQANSDLFIEAISVLDTQEKLTKDQIYSALTTAYEFKELSNSTYPGMAQALAVYESAYTAYSAPIQTVNAEMLETVDVVFAARKPYTALDAIAKFFEKLFA